MNEFDLRLQNALAKRKAGQDALQSFQTPQGQMVGGVYIKPSISDSLIQGLRMYSGKKDAESADQEIKDVMQQRTESTNKALAEFLRNSKGTPANAPQDGVGPVMPAQAPNMEAAYGALMQSPDLRQMGQQGMMQLPQIEAQKQEREDARLFRQQEAQAQRDARAQELQMRMQDQRTSQQEKLASQRELQQMQIDARKDMQRMIASTRQAPQAQIIQTDAGPMQLVNGQAIPIVGPDGKPVAAPKKGAAGLSATAQKELFEADDAVQNGMGAIGSLQKALELNKDAYSGVGAATRATIRSNLPGSSKAADATIAMENIIKDQALTSMKSIFGGNPTEGERAILLDLQASASKTPKQREEILNRAMQAAQRRTEFNKQKAESLRGGTYMSEGGAPQVQSSQSNSKRLKFDAQGNILP